MSNPSSSCHKLKSYKSHYKRSRHRTGKMETLGVREYTTFFKKFSVNIWHCDCIWHQASFLSFRFKKKKMDLEAYFCRKENKRLSLGVLSIIRDFNIMPQELLVISSRISIAESSLAQDLLRGYKLS